MPSHPRTTRRRGRPSSSGPSATRGGLDRTRVQVNRRPRLPGPARWRHGLAHDRERRARAVRRSGDDPDVLDAGADGGGQAVVSRRRYPPFVPVGVVAHAATGTLFMSDPKVAQSLTARVATRKRLQLRYFRVLGSVWLSLRACPLGRADRRATRQSPRERCAQVRIPTCRMTRCHHVITPMRGGPNGLPRGLITHSKGLVVRTGPSVIWEELFRDIGKRGVQLEATRQQWTFLAGSRPRNCSGAQLWSATQ